MPTPMSTTPNTPAPPTAPPTPPTPAAPTTGSRGAVGTVRRDDLVPAALAYAARGWHVFPLRPDDKRPAFPDHSHDACDRAAAHGAHRRDVRCVRAGRHVTWEERATTDPARIRTAWTQAPYGIGIACGPSGLVVIDLDIPKPDPATGRPVELPDPWRLAGVRDGADIFTIVCQQAGEPVPWDTYAVNTASGGTHLYYAAPTPERGHDRPPLRNTTGGAPGSLGPLIDTRAGGGYVVAPPSTANGRPYTLASDADTPTAPLPPWLTERLTPAPLPAQKPVTVPLRAAHGDADDRAAAYLDAAVERSLAAIADAPAGARNRALYGAAVSLGQLVAGGALEPEATATQLEAAGRAVGQTPAEAARTVASGIRAGANRPRHLPRTTPATHEQGAAA